MNVKKAFMGNPSVERHRCTDCIVTQITVAVIVFTDLTSVSVSYASGDEKIKKQQKAKPESHHTSTCLSQTKTRGGTGYRLYKETMPFFRGQ